MQRTRCRSVWTLAMALVAPAMGADRAWSQAAPPANSVTCVGNSGYLLRAGGKAILIDALFGDFPGTYSLPASVREPLLAGLPPFDGIDLILVTHRHGDHFSAEVARRALESNPRAVLVGPADVVAALAGLGDRARVMEVAEGQRGTTEVNGVRIDAMRLSHGAPPPGRPDIVNLAYLVTAGGVKFFHTGDIDISVIPTSYLQGLGVPDDHVDVAFVPHFLLGGAGPPPFVTEGIRPRFVVASHIQFTGTPFDEDRIRRNFPTAVVLRTEGERWNIP